MIIFSSKLLAFLQFPYLYLYCFCVYVSYEKLSRRLVNCNSFDFLHSLLANSWSTSWIRSLGMKKAAFIGSRAMIAPSIYMGETGRSLITIVHVDAWVSNSHGSSAFTPIFSLEDPNTYFTSYKKQVALEEIAIISTNLKPLTRPTTFSYVSISNFFCLNKWFESRSWSICNRYY